jgi:hypothetical protein
MIPDDVIREVRAAREAYAAAHGYDIPAMVADLKAQDLQGDWEVVTLPGRKPVYVSPVAPSNVVGSALPSSHEVSSAAPTTEQ